MPIGSLIETAAGFATGIVERIWPKKMDDTAKAETVLEIQKLIEARDQVLITSQKEIIVAELQQGDTFTKRARPMIVYVGLGAIVFNHVFLPFVNRIVEWITILRTDVLPDAFVTLSKINLPEEFWYVWGGVCSVYALGRTAEKRGARNALIGWVTGNKKLGGG